MELEDECLCVSWLISSHILFKSHFYPVLNPEKSTEVKRPIQVLESYCQTQSYWQESMIRTLGEFHGSVIPKMKLINSKKWSQRFP